jgi:uncharacterized membrane protein (DUF373 family)
VIERSPGGVEENQDRAVALGNRLLRIVEDVVYLAIAALLAIGAVVLLVEAGGQVLRAATKGDVPGAMLDMLDTLLLVFIFAELLFAVRSTLAERKIVAEPFLIVGILAAIKEIVVLSVKAASILGDGPQFARAAVEIGVLAGLVLVLSIAAVLLRVKEREPEENGDDGDAVRQLDGARGQVSGAEATKARSSA